MAACFDHNVNCCWLPSHTSHGLQALDNGVFAVLKGAYQKAVSTLTSLNGASPVGKINFIKYLVEARKAVSDRTIKGAFRHIGTWPINRIKPTQHLEFNPIDDEDIEPLVFPEAVALEPVNRQMIRDIKQAVPDSNRTARNNLDRIANAFDNNTAQIAFLERENASLKAQLEEATKTKKKRKVKLNPNAKFQSGGFISIEEIVDGGNTIEDLEEEEERPHKRARKSQKAAPVVVDESEDEDSEAEDSEADGYEIPAEIRTRAGRTTRKNRRYEDLALLNCV